MIIKDFNYRNNFRSVILNHINNFSCEWMFHPNIDYLIFSRYGEVKSLKTNKILKQSSNVDGYKMVNVIYKNGQRRCAMVHRLIAESFYSFLGTKNYVYEVNHINGNKKDNYLENLEWLTREENLQHARDNKLFVSLKGEANGNCKFSKKDIDNMFIMKQNGFKNVEISRKFGIDRNYLTLILKGEKRIYG